jgi:signal transduction histidine kinase
LVTPLSKLPIAQSVVGVAASNAPGIGGAVVAALLSGGTSHLAQQLEECRAELRDTQRELRDVSKQLGEARETAATLTERVRAIGRFKHLQNFAIAAGGVALSIAFNLQRVDMATEAAVVAIFGGALILLGWNARGDR